MQVPDAADHVREMVAMQTCAGGEERRVASALRMGEKAKQLGIEQVAFDRSGFKYHGRVKALADAAREGGLKF